MKTQNSLNTGYNPDYFNSIGTANEYQYKEETAPGNNLAYFIKNNELIIEEDDYTDEIIYKEDQDT